MRKKHSALVRKKHSALFAQIEIKDLSLRLPQERIENRLLILSPKWQRKNVQNSGKKEEKEKLNFFVQIRDHRSFNSYKDENKAG